MGGMCEQPTLLPRGGFIVDNVESWVWPSTVEILVPASEEEKSSVWKMIKSVCPYTPVREPGVSHRGEWACAWKSGTNIRKICKPVRTCQIRQKRFAPQLTPSGKTKAWARRFFICFSERQALLAFLASYLKTKGSIFLFWKGKKYITGKKLQREKWNFGEKLKKKIRAGRNCHPGSGQQTFSSLSWWWYLPAADV